MKTKVRSLFHFPFHYAWLILALVFLVTLTGGGIRSITSVLISPLEKDFGWSRVFISSVVGINLLFYGVGAPVAGWLIDRVGPRKVALWSLALIGSAMAGSIYMSYFWQFILYWGIIIGLSSSGAASVIAGPVVNRWFIARRGLALGILSSASATGQVVFLPLLIMVVGSAGWHIGLKIILPVIVVVFLLAFIWLHNDPGDIGIKPYGAMEETSLDGAKVKVQGTKVSMSKVIRNSTFWLLAASFFICGGTSNGLVGTHFIPNSIDCGIPQATAAATMGIMGATNFFGSIFSGWLTDRIDPRKILIASFGLRAISLIILPFVHDFVGLFLFGIIYGLDFAATIPPVVTLTVDTFGKRSLGTVYGFIFLAHQVGASLAAFGGGALRVAFGDYQLAFFLGGAAALIAAALALGIPSRQVLRQRRVEV